MTLPARRSFPCYRSSFYGLGGNRIWLGVIEGIADVAGQTGSVLEGLVLVRAPTCPSIARQGANGYV
jgi:hypothetical protein